MFALQYLTPFLHKLFAVDDLKLLNPLRRVSARGDTFVMNKSGERLVDHSVTQRSHAEAKIDVFIVGRGKAAIEATQAAKKFCSNQQRRGGTIINRTCKPEPWIVGLTSPAVVIGFAVSPDDCPGFLDRSFRVEKHRTHSAHQSISFDSL